MPFLRDLCSGIVGNCRNCMTTPLTRNKILIISGLVLSVILLAVIIIVSVPSGNQDSKGRDALNNVPLVEGNSDFKDYMTSNFIVSGYKYDKHFKEAFGAQVIAASVDCGAQFKDAVSQTIDQLDFLKRLVDGSKYMKIALNAQEIRTNKDSNYRSVVLALEGGHSIDTRLSVLRSYFHLGVRVINLASKDCTNPWAMSITGDEHNITSNGEHFLKAVVKEMNRLGVAIDLAGSDKTVQTSVLNYSEAPVIYRGIGLNSLVKNKINLDDDLLEKMKSKSGLAMLSLDCSLISKGANCSKKDFIEFLNEAKSKLGVKNIGIGGLVYHSGKMPKDLDYKDFPSLFDELKNNGWSIADLECLAGNNFIYFLQKVEEVANKMANKPTEDFYNETIPLSQGCHTPPPTPNPSPHPTATP